LQAWWDVVETRIFTEIARKFYLARIELLYIALNTAFSAASKIITSERNKCEKCNIFGRFLGEIFAKNRMIKKI
jgi:hypothetical protein